MNTLIVCEKPDAALHVAEALDEKGRPKKVDRNGVPYFELSHGKDTIVVCSALGHLYQVDSRDSVPRKHYPVWDFAWKPKHMVERGQKKQEQWLKTIGDLARDADTFINACDFDIEGSLIGYMVLKYACNGADSSAKRMKFSTLTEKELRSAYKDIMQSLDYTLAYAGMCRHEVDWLYGINLSRALTESAYKHSKKYATLSTGRVQGPALRFVVEREKEIFTFVPEPFWVILAAVDVKGQKIEAEYQKDKIEIKTEADEIAKACTSQTGTINDLESRKLHLSPPHPFDLSALQAEAYRHFGYTPSHSLGIAERLYLDALISYPRTSSQKLPPSIGYKEILTGLSQIPGYEKNSKILLAKELKPNEGKKDDPAHPAIYPTGQVPKRKLDPREQKLFDLVVKRFMATFVSAALKQSDKAIVDVKGHTFYLRGSRILEKGWIEFYEPYTKLEEAILPPITIGEAVTFQDVLSQEKFTQPPSRFNPSSILKLMEEENLGTKATRADIIETLYRRGYIKGERIMATPLAFDITQLLSHYCPKVTDVQFTRELEEKMENIELGKEQREKVILETVDHLKPILEGLKNKETEIGKILSETIRRMRLSEITLASPCPNCGATLFVLRSRRSGKRFVGCSGRWKTQCNFGLPLPQFGILTLLEKNCKECGFQMVQVRTKGRRPLVSCPRCFVNKLKAKKEAEKAPPQVDQAVSS